MLKQSFAAFAALVFALIFAPRLFAQTANPDSTPAYSSSSSTALPDAPSERRLLSSSIAAKKAPPPPDGAFGDLLRGNASCGSGATVQSGAPQNGVAMCGFGFTFVPGVQVEFGGIGPQGGWARFYISADGYVPLAPVANRLSTRLHGEPVAPFGYTKMFYNSNDLDFGLGWDRHLNEGASLVYEIRDYVQFSATTQHTVMFRVNLVGGGAD